MFGKCDLNFTRVGLLIRFVDICAQTKQSLTSVCIGELIDEKQFRMQVCGSWTADIFNSSGILGN